MSFHGAVTDLFPNGRLQMTGTYEANKKHGEFTFYYDNGTVESTGQFENDNRSGTWKYFYRNGRPRMEVDFAPVLGDDAVIHYLNDSTGQSLLKDGNGEWREVAYYANGIRQTVLGHYKNHQKDGKWTYTISDEKIIREEIFKDGIFKRGTLQDEHGKTMLNEALDYTVYLPDKFFYTENFFAKNGIDFTSYPSLKRLYINGKMLYNGPAPEPKSVPLQTNSEEVFTIVEVMAEPEGGFGVFFKEIDNIYNSLFRKAKKCGPGKVFVELIVEKGRIPGAVYDRTKPQRSLR